MNEESVMDGRTVGLRCWGVCGYDDAEGEGGGRGARPSGKPRGSRHIANSRERHLCIDRD